MKKLMTALASALAMTCAAGLAQAQTFPNYVPNPAPVEGGGSGARSSGPVNPNTDYLIVSRVQSIPGVGQSLVEYGLLPMSSFAGSSDLSNTNENLVTTNANLATTNANLTTTNANLATTNANLATTNANLATTNANVAALGAGLATTNQNLIGVRSLAFSIRREAREGAASAMALSTAPMPSAPGRTSWTVNAAEFHGQPGGGGSVAHRLVTSARFAVTAGFAFSGASNGGRVGFSGEF
jgi:hypothetical protein